MLAPWSVGRNQDGRDLNDERLNERFMRLVDAFSKNPTLSIPAACGGAAETEAALPVVRQRKGHVRQGAAAAHR